MTLKKKRVIETSVNIILNILIFIFGVVFLISIYTSVQTKILGNKYTNFFGYSIFEVQTGSMEEVISPSDWIIVKLTQKVRVDDIVTYELDGEYITHRIVEAYQGTYITRGDANNANDKKPVDQKQIIGKVTNILGSFGILRKTLFNPGVLITLIITLGLFNLTFKKDNAKNEQIILKTKNITHQVFDRINKLYQIVKQNLIKYKPTLSTKKVVKLDEDDEFKELLYKVDSEETVEPIMKSNEQKEEELGKTAIFRMVSVDPLEVTDKYKETSIINDDEEKEEEKTSLFRVIAVDSSEVDKKYQDIVKNEKSKKGNLILPKKEAVQESKKGKNIIDSVMLLEKEKLNNLIDVLIEKNQNMTIKKEFINTYIDIRYYQQGDIKGPKFKQAIENFGQTLINNYTGKNNKYPEAVNIYSKMFVLISILEKGRETLSDVKIRTEFFTKELLKVFKNIESKDLDKKTKEIKSIQNKYTKTVNDFLKSLKTNMFILKEKQFTSNENLYGLQFNHKINFSKVSDGNSNDIAEDEVPVLFTLLSEKILTDMIEYNQNKNYVLMLPKQLYEKSKKIDKLLKMIDDKYAKAKTIIAIEYSDYLSYKKEVKRISKMGYNFAVVFNKEQKIKKSEQSSLNIASYLIVNNKVMTENAITSLLPNQMSSKVVYEDILPKLSGLGGEK